jgi:hypothetical protein
LALDYLARRFGSRHGIPGAQPAEVFLRALRTAYAD